jgi:hypothetical protein
MHLSKVKICQYLVILLELTMKQALNVCLGLRGNTRGVSNGICVKFEKRLWKLRKIAGQLFLP